MQNLLLLFLYLTLQGSYAFTGGNNLLDGSVLVEVHTVDAHLTMEAGAIGLGEEVTLVDAVIHNIPLITTGNLQHAVVCRTVDLLASILD